MSGADSVEPKARPLRVPVLDIPVRNSILVPEGEASAQVGAVAEAERPSVIPQPVRVVSDPAPAPNGEAPADADFDAEEPLELSPMEASVEAALEGANAPAAQDEDLDPDVEVTVSEDDDDDDDDGGPYSIDPADTLEIDPDAEAESVEQPRASVAQPPPPPAGSAPPPRPSAAVSAPPPTPPSAGASLPPVKPSGRLERTTVDLDPDEAGLVISSRPAVDLDVTDEEEENAVVIDLTRDEPDAASATAVPSAGEGSEPELPVRRSRATPPPPPNSRGPSGAAAHRVADLKPSKPRKQHWWESFFNDDYLRSVRSPGREAVARKCDFIEKRLGLSPGATVLDVGCGWGAEVVELSTRGYLGVGLDLSLAMLSRAADEAQERGQRINFLHADMREMNFDGTFDAVMCLGTTFGYFDDDTNRQVIGRLRRALKPQGVLLLETVNRDHVIRSQPNLVWFEGDGCVCMEETEFNYFTSRLHVKRTVILDDGRQRENEYSVRLYSLHEIGQMLHHQGFRVTEVSGRMAVPGVFFGQESPGLLVVAERRVDGTGKHSMHPLEEAAFEEDE